MNWGLLKNVQRIPLSPFPSSVPAVGVLRGKEFPLDSATCSKMGFTFGDSLAKFLIPEDSFFPTPFPLANPRGISWET